MRTLEEIAEQFARYPLIPGEVDGNIALEVIPPLIELIGYVQQLQTKLSDLEAKIQKAEATAHHANNIASCLANGIQPD